MARNARQNVTWAAVFAVTAWLLLLAHPLSADVGLHFVRNPEPIAAPPGDEVVFECSLNVPAEHVRWRHGGSFLQPGGGNEGGGGGNHSVRATSLVVKVVDEREAGDYQCVAWFGASALASVPARLSLAEMKPFPTRPARVYEVYAGNTVALHLDTPASNPPAILQCAKDGSKLNTTVASTGTLLLPNVTQRDAGSYVCSAFNFITGQTLPSTHVLSLAVKPSGSGRAPLRFLAPLQDTYIVQAGWNVTLECSAVGNPPPRVTWQKYGGSLPRDRTQLVDGGLVLRSIVRGDEGTYICELNNGVGPPLTHVVMVHLHEPPVILKEPANVVGEEGGEVNLECQVKGAPDPEVTWLLNGEPLHNDSAVKTNGVKLHISPVAKWHAGIFQCFATNPLGSVYGSALLQVSPKQVTANPNGDLTPETEEESGFEDVSSNGDKGFHTPVHSSTNRNPGGKKDHTRKGNGRRKDKHKHKGNTVMIPPSRPNITRLTDSSVMVRWHVPPNDGLPIQFFKVQHREMWRGNTGGRRRGGKGSRWGTNNDDIPPHIRSYEVDGLETDHTYRFRIAAVYSNNDNKLSPNSGRFHLHRGPTNNKHPLVAPLLTHTEAVSPTAIQIHWQHLSPAPNSPPVDGFYVYYRATSSAGDYVKATVEGDKTRSYNITHLQHETAYDIKLQSFTVGGASDFSAILTHKTLSAPTEQPPVSMTPEVVGANKTPGGGADSQNNQLVLVICAVLGGLALLFLLVLVIWLCNRRRNNANQAVRDSSERPAKLHGPALQLQPVPVPVPLFNKSLGNGRLPQNGYLHNSKVNITSNPLAESEEDKNQIALEMTFLSSRNNNCSAGSGTSRGSSSSDESSPDVTPPPPTEPSKPWRGAAGAATAPTLPPPADLPLRAATQSPAAELSKTWRGAANVTHHPSLVENYV